MRPGLIRWRFCNEGLCNFAIEPPRHSCHEKLAGRLHPRPAQTSGKGPPDASEDSRPAPSWQCRVFGMTNLAGKPPLGQKAGKPAPDRAHLARIRLLPCCICHAFGEPQTTPTEAHHTIQDRFSQRKTADQVAIPLCAAHHRTGEDGKVAIHASPAEWKRRYGADTDYITQTQTQVEIMQ